MYGYEAFKEEIKKAVENRLGESYTVIIQSVPKNNGVLLDGLCTSKREEEVSPTIYLNAFYEQYQEGAAMEELLEEIVLACTERSALPQLDTKEFNDFESLRDKVVYKLVQTEANAALLMDIPHIPYLDLSVVFYLLLQEGEDGQMTALIHNSHQARWGVSTEELYQMAEENSPRLLPVDLKCMADVIKEIAKKQLGDDYQEEFMDMLLGDEEKNPMYVLSNRSGLNGASAMLYSGVLKNFSEMLECDVVILPSSIHEMLLLPYNDDMDFDELSDMVRHINKTEVSVEDVLSNQVYQYVKEEEQVFMMTLGGCAGELSLIQGVC